jgi:hypothetical protein
MSSDEDFRHLMQIVHAEHVTARSNLHAVELHEAHCCSEW